MKNVFTAAALVLTLAPAFAFAKMTHELEGTQINCKGGGLEVTISIQKEIEQEKSWQTHYEAMLSGPRLYQPTTVIAQSVSTRVYGGLELKADFNGNTLQVQDILFSSNEHWAPVGVSGKLVDSDGKLLLKLSCAYLQN